MALFAVLRDHERVRVRESACVTQVGTRARETPGGRALCWPAGPRALVPWPDLRKVVFGGGLVVKPWWPGGRGMLVCMLCYAL